MKKYVNGKYIDMTPEEVEQLKVFVPELPETDDIKERVAKIENAISKLESFFNKLGVK